MFDYENAFDYTKPTAALIGRFQPRNEEHTKLFIKSLTLTGQIVIMVREVYNPTEIESDNPFGEIAVIDRIKKSLGDAGFEEGQEYMIQMIPNVVDVTLAKQLREDEL